MDPRTAIFLYSYGITCLAITLIGIVLLIARSKRNRIEGLVLDGNNVLSTGDSQAPRGPFIVYPRDAYGLGNPYHPPPVAIRFGFRSVQPGMILSGNIQEPSSDSQPITPPPPYDNEERAHGSTSHAGQSSTEVHPKKVSEEESSGEDAELNAECSIPYYGSTVQNDDSQQGKNTKNWENFD